MELIVKFLFFVDLVRGGWNIVQEGVRNLSTFGRECVAPVEAYTAT
jgi:hypothetical protein